MTVLVRLPQDSPVEDSPDCFCSTLTALCCHAKLKAPYADKISQHPVQCQRFPSLYTLARLEETWISTALRESGFAFFTSLSIHSLAMALVVGINIALCLRLLTLPINNSVINLCKFYRLHWLGVSVIFASGVALLLAYPAKALTNPVFYVKLVALGFGLIMARSTQELLSKQGFSAFKVRRLKQLSATALPLWAITIATGRFLAYTNSVLLASRYY